MKNKIRSIFTSPACNRATPSRRIPKLKRGLCNGGLIGSAMAGLALITISMNASGQAVPLGSASGFAVISSQGVTNSGASNVTGNIALSPLTTITGFSFSTPAGAGVVTGTVHYNDLQAIQAQADALTAYNTIAGRSYLPGNNLTGMDLGGLTLTPGTYHFDTSVGLTGSLTLNTLSDPNAVFIFQIGSTLTAAVGSSVVVTGAGAGTDPNLFWQVGSSATFNTGSSFSGNVLALASVSFGTGSQLSNGRVIALNGAVTLLGNNISVPALAPAAPGRFWNGSANNLWSATNWSSTVAGLDQINLGAGADVVFSVNPAHQNQNTTLDFDATISSLTVNDAAAVTIAGTNTLAVSSTGLVTGININSGAGATTISSKLLLGNLSQIVTVNNAAGLLISGVVGGSNGLTKAGTGTLVLTAAEIYTGSTEVAGGTLQIGDGVTAGTSIASSGPVFISSLVVPPVLAINLASGETFGNSATNNGQIRWIQQGTNTQASTSVFSGTGNMLVTASGTTILLGSNTFSGGTTIDTSGSVLVGNLSAGTSSAFGTGFLTIRDGYLDTYNSKVLTITTGGYVQSGGEIGIHLQGATPGSYTRFDVAGTSTLSGGTVFVYDDTGVYVPQGSWLGNSAGDTQNIIHTTGGLSGEFASNNPFSRIYNSAFNQDFLYHHGDTLLYPTLTYDASNAYVNWVQDSFRSVPGLTRNQDAVGGVLDGYQNENPSTSGSLVTYLDGQNIADLPAMYDLIAPDELTAIFQMGFAASELQNTNIERHLDQVRQAGGPPAEYTPASRDSKGGVIEPTMMSREGPLWSFFFEGSGGSASVDSTASASGYDFNSLGFTLGADRRVGDHFAVGFLGGYSNSDASLVNGGSIDVETYRGAVYATVFGNGFFADALLGAGYNSYDTKRASMFGFANGSSDGWQLDALINTGYDFHQGNWTFTPNASLGYTQVNLNSFTETGSLSSLSFPDQSQDSLRSELGAKISYAAVVNGMKITPQLRIAWQHEFLDSTQSIDSRFATGTSPLFSVDGPRIGRDRAVISAGLGIQFTPSVSGYVFYDGLLGGSGYSSNTVSAGVKMDF
ncbi:MAG: hypothetical protein CFE26_04215 [Verrucomicrobiales bacterium VVV1]|nr:MAG: hypothetical protein CFE26_04215 [Verrucomicrobiales bacterium VVV1]